MEVSGSDIGTAIGGAVTTIVGFALWIKKQKPEFAKAEASANVIEATGKADLSIIERLEKECKRLSDQNDVLAKSVNAFQLQLVTFQTENQKLSFENNALREENLSLREEIMELRKEVHELGQELMKIQARHNANCIGCVHA